MNHPVLLIDVLCGYERQGWINPNLCKWLMQMYLETNVPIAVAFEIGVVPVERARNIAARRALEAGAEWLLMIDNDIAPPPGILHVVEQAGPEHDVVLLPCLGVADDGLALMFKSGAVKVKVEPGSGFQEVTTGGTGAIFIRRRVLERMTAPHFAMQLSADGLDLLKGEDCAFCERARELGFRIWTHGDYPCEHYHQFELSCLAGQLRGGARHVR